MSALVKASTNPTMTSKQIAVVVNSRHDHVKRSIERLSTTTFNTDGSIKRPAVIVRPPMEDEQFTDSMGRNRTESVYVVNERDSYVVVAQLCPEYTANLVDYWMATKNQAPALPTNYIEALEQLLISKKSEQQANERLAIAAPKVSYFDAVVDREHLLNATQVAQKLKLSAVALNRKLDEMGVYNKAVKSSRVFQQWFVDKGYGLVRQTEMGYPQAMFTLSGEAWVVGKLISEGEI